MTFRHKTKKPRVIEYRDNNRINEEILGREFYSLPWDILYSFTNADCMVSHPSEPLFDLFEKHVPDFAHTILVQILIVYVKL